MTTEQRLTAGVTYSSDQVDLLFKFSEDSNNALILIDFNGSIVKTNSLVQSFLNIANIDPKDTDLLLSDAFRKSNIVSPILNNEAFKGRPDQLTLNDTYIPKLNALLEWKYRYVISNKKDETVLLIGSYYTSSIQREYSQDKYYLESLLSSIPGAIFWKDRAGTLLKCNDELAKLAGLNSAAELVGKNDYECFWAARAEEYRGNDQKVMTTGEAGFFEEVHGDAEAGQKIRTFLAVKAPLRNYHGAIDGVLGIGFDITKTKLLQEKLAAEKEAAEKEKVNTSIYLQSVIKNMPGNVYWKSKEGVILACNDQLAQMAGFDTADEAIGKSDDDFVWKTQAELIRENDRQVMRSRRPHSFEETATMRDGSIATFLTIKSPLFDHHNEVIGVMGISIDITKRKEVEAALKQSKLYAEAANQSKSMFIASLGHEFRTPINNIISLSGILADSKYEITLEERNEFLNAINNSGRQILKLVDDVINFSKMETLEYTTDFEQFDLENTIRKIVHTNAHRLNTSNVTLSFNYANDAVKIIESDKLRVRQIITNLLDNAIKYTHKGTICIEVSQPLPSKNFITMKFRDTGVGIKPEDLTRIFEEFTQVYDQPDDRKMGNYSGIGLGLSIVKQLVELIGGEIGVESRYGEGSCFTVNLPIKHVRTE